MLYVAVSFSVLCVLLSAEQQMVLIAADCSVLSAVQQIVLIAAHCINRNETGRIEVSGSRSKVGGG